MIAKSFAFCCKVVKNSVSRRTRPKGGRTHDLDTHSQHAHKIFSWRAWIQGSRFAHPLGGCGAQMCMGDGLCNLAVCGQQGHRLQHLSCLRFSIADRTFYTTKNLVRLVMVGCVYVSCDATRNAAICSPRLANNCFHSTRWPIKTTTCHGNASSISYALYFFDESTP